MARASPCCHSALWKTRATQSSDTLERGDHLLIFRKSKEHLGPLVSWHRKHQPYLIRLTFEVFDLAQTPLCFFERLVGPPRFVPLFDRT